MPKSPIPNPQSPLRPSPMPRSQTSPALSSDAESPEKAITYLNGLGAKVNTAKEEEGGPPTREICLSPSWSDHGEKKRKKEKKRMEKEQKELEKRLKQDAEIKAGKRLSKKPPPAAMETQKMPLALRRNSWMSLISSQPSSGENSRRSSRDEKRLSGISLSSLKSKRRSQSTPGTSAETVRKIADESEQWHSIVSPAAPKLPSFGWRSRKNSFTTDQSIPWDSDDGYEKDLITFAYRLEGSATGSESECMVTTEYKVQPASRTTTSHQSSIPPTLNRSVTEPDLTSAMQQSMQQSMHTRSRQRSPEKKRYTVDNRSPSRVDDFRAQPPKSDSHATQQKEDTGETVVAVADHNNESGHDFPSSPKRRPQLQMRSSHDGSSYVHKQRMYQQQRSIAGFEDEQAVKDANDIAAEIEAIQAEKSVSTYEPDSAPEPRKQSAKSVARAPDVTRRPSENIVTTSVYTKQKYRDKSPSVQPAQAKQPSNDSLKPQVMSQTDGTSEAQQHESLHTSLQSARDLVFLNKTQITPGSKTDRILGFRRRSKAPPAQISVPAIGQNHTLALQSAPPSVTNLEEPMEKRSRIERLFREPKPAFADSSERKRSGSSTSSKAKEPLSDAKLLQSLASTRPTEILSGVKAVQTHTRNRTSSSTVLNDSLPSAMPRSTPESAAKPKAEDGKHSRNNRKAHRDSKLEDSRSKPSEVVLDRKHTSKAVPDAKSTQKAANTTDSPSNPMAEVKSITKATREMVIESTTGDGLVRTTSIKRPRSNPQLQTQTTAMNSLPSLDFLPPLKHQPLIKAKLHSPPRPMPAEVVPPTMPQSAEYVSPLALQNPLTSHPPDLKLIPRSPLRPPSQFPVPTTNRRRTHAPTARNNSSPEVATNPFGKGTLAEGLDAKPVAKLFVICCKCKFWHDLPSKLYEAMALPKELHKDEHVAGGKVKGKSAGARLETAVKCPWCEHAMTTWCCQGWTTVVYLHERHH